MFNPESVLNDVIDILRNDVPLIQSALTAAQTEANVREYDDEFKSEDAEWKFSAPAVFLQMLKASPKSFDVSAQPMSYDYDMIIFICHDSSDVPAKTHILELVKQVHDALSGEVLTEGEDEVTVQCGVMDFLGKNNKMSVYTLDVKTIAG